MNLQVVSRFFAISCGCVSIVCTGSNWPLRGFAPENEVTVRVCALEISQFASLIFSFFDSVLLIAGIDIDSTIGERALLHGAK